MSACSVFVCARSCLLCRIYCCIRIRLVLRARTKSKSIFINNGAAVGPARKNLMHDLSPLIEIVYLWRIACCNDQAIKRAPSRGRGTHPFFSELQRKKKQGLSGETCGCRVRLSCLFQKQRRCTSVSAWGYAHAPDWLLCANRLCLGRLNNRSASLLWEERPQTCQQH